MATRIYTTISTTVGVTPSSWNFAAQINPVTVAGTTIKNTGATMTSKTEATGTTNPTARAMGRTIIGPLAAQTITGTVKGQMRGQENNANANATIALAIKIIQPNGTDRGVLLAQTASDNLAAPNELSTSLTNTKFANAAEATAITLTSQAVTEGDYLVIEWGFRSATGTSRNITLSYGNNSATDLAEDTSTTAANNPWWEFTHNIVWLILGDTIAATSGVHVPTVANTQLATTASIGAESSVFGPTVEAIGAPQAVTTNFISSGSAAFEPTVVLVILTVVQTTTKVQVSTVTSITIPFATPPTVGNGIVIPLAAHIAGSVTLTDAIGTAVDSNGQSLAWSAAADASLSDIKAVIYYLPKLAAVTAPYSVTITFNGFTCFGATACGIEVTNVDLGLTADTTAALSNGLSYGSETGASSAATVDTVFTVALCSSWPSTSLSSLTVETVSPPWVQAFEELAPFKPVCEADSRVLTGQTGLTQSCSWVAGGETLTSAAALTSFRASPVLVVVTPIIPKTSSSFAPTVVGGAIASQAITTAPLSLLTLCSEGFNRANSLLHGSTLDNGDGGSLTATWIDQKGVFQIISGHVVAAPTTPTSDSTTVANPEFGNQQIVAVANEGASSNKDIGLICRWQPGANPSGGSGGLYYLYYMGNGSLYKATGAGFTVLGTGTTPGSLAQMQLEARGSTIICTLNAAVQISVTDTDYATGKLGLYAGAATQLPYLDNVYIFANGAMCFSPTVALPTVVTAPTIASGSGLFAPTVVLIEPATAAFASLLAFWIGGAVPAVLEVQTAHISGGDVLLLENGEGLLLEDGGAFLQETHPGTSQAFAPTIALDTALTVGAGTVAPTSAATPPSVAVGAVTVVGVTIASTATRFTPTVVPQAVTITAGTRPTTVQVNAPTVVPQAVGITTGTIASTATATGPTVIPQAVGITTAHRATTIVVNVPTVIPQTVTITGAHIGSTVTVGAPAIVVMPGHIATTAILFAPTIVPQAVAVTAGTRPLTSSAFAPTVIPQAVTVVAGTVAATSLVRVPTVIPQAVGVTAGTVAATTVVRVPTVIPQAVGITAGTVAAANQRFVPTVVPGAVAVTAGTIASTSQTNVATVTVGPVAVLMAHIALVVSLFVPVLSQVSPGDIGGQNVPTTAVVNAPSVVGGLATINVPAIAPTSSTSAPTIAVGPASVTGGTVTTTAQAFAPTVVPQAVGITAGHVTTTNQRFAPTVAAGAVTVLAQTVASTALLNPPIVIGAGAVVTAPMASTVVLNAPTLTVGAVSVVAQTVPATSQVFAPTVGVGVTAVSGGTVSTTAQVFAPTMVARLSGTFIASTAQLFPPTVIVTRFVTTATVPTGVVLFAPSLLPVEFVTAGHVSSTAVVRAPSVTVGPTTVVTGTIASASSATAPSQVLPGAVFVTTPPLILTSQVFAPTLIARLDTAFIGASTTLFAPSVTQNVTTAFLASSTGLFPPSLLPITLVGGPTILNTVFVYAPVLQEVAPGAVIVGGVETTAEVYPPSVTEVPFIPGEPCLTSRVTARCLVEAAAIECKILVGAASMKVRTIAASTTEPQAPVVATSIEVRTLVTSDTLHTCCLEASHE